MEPARGENRVYPVVRGPQERARETGRKEGGRRSGQNDWRHIEHMRSGMNESGGIRRLEKRRGYQPG